MVIDERINEIHNLMISAELKFNNHVYNDDNWWEGVGGNEKYYILPVMNQGKLTLVVLYNDGIISLISEHTFKYSDGGNSAELPRNIGRDELFQMSTITEILEYESLQKIYEVYEHVIGVIEK